MAKKTISSSFVVTTVEDGESAPYYFQEMFAWSNDASTVSVTTAPTLPSGHTWENSIPDSYATYLWCQSTRFVWNESTREYTQNGVEYYRKSGTNGTSITTKGSLPYAYASFPPNSAENIGKLAIIQGDGRIYKCQTTQSGTIDWIPTKTSADGDSYTVESGNFDGNYQSQDVLGGHFVMWSAEASKWLDLGVFKGENGVTYYTHIVWATNVIYNGSTVTSIEGYAADKAPSDTTHLWMGTYIDRNSADPISGSDVILKRYTWSYTKGVDGQSAFVADLSNENDSVALDSNGKTIAATNIFSLLSVFYGTSNVTSVCGIKYTSKPTNSNVFIQSSGSGTSDSVQLNPTTYTTIGARAYIRLNFANNVSVSANETVNLVINHSTYGTLELKMSIAGIKGGAIYRLVPSSNAISRKENGTFSPVTVSCTAEKIDALTGNVTSSPAEATIKYTKDGGSTQYTYNGTLTAGTDFTNSVQFLLLLGGNIVDRETVPIVRDGANGNDSVVYELTPSKNIVTLDEDGTPVFDYIFFSLKKTIGNNTPVIYTDIDQWEAQNFHLYYVVNGAEYEVSYTDMRSFDTKVNYHDIEWLYSEYQNVEWLVKKTNTINPIARLGIGTVSNGSEGEKGKIGRFFYYAGKLNDFLSTDTFVVSDAQAPYFQYGGTEDVPNYWVFNPTANRTYSKAQMGTPSSGSADWELMTNDFKYIITEALFGKYAHLGSFVINGDWMISTNGTINGVEYVDGANATVDGVTKVAYTFFDVAHPSENNNGKNFVPNLAIDARTGAGHLAKGNIVFNANGDVTVQNAIVKGSLMYRKVVMESNYNSLAIAYDDGTIHTIIKGDTFVVRGSSTFEISFPPAYLFKGAQIKIVVGVVGQVENLTYEMFVTRKDGEEKKIPKDSTAAGWPPYNCFYAAIPVTSGGIENKYGRLESLQFTSADYHCVEFVSTPNPDTNLSQYYVWMLVDAR